MSSEVMFYCSSWNKSHYDSETVIDNWGVHMGVHMECSSGAGCSQYRFNKPECRLLVETRGERSLSAPGKKHTIIWAKVTISPASAATTPSAIINNGYYFCNQYTH